LAQPHGSYFNACLTPNIQSKRQHSSEIICTGPTVAVNSKTEKRAPANSALSTNRINRLSDHLKFTANKEVFDIRAGEPVCSSVIESGFPNHRRGYVFSSLNGIRASTGSTDLRSHFDSSDIEFAGLCQNDYVSSGNDSLREQGLAVQCSGIKTIISK
jgi:hypothetical protein